MAWQNQGYYMIALGEKNSPWFLRDSPRPFGGFNGVNVPWFIWVVGGEEYDKLHGEDVEEDPGRAPQHAVPDTLQYNKYVGVLSLLCVREE